MAVERLQEKVDRLQRVRRIAAEAKHPNLRDLDASTLEAMTRDAEARRDELAAAIESHGDEAAAAKQSGRWRRMEDERDGILHLREEFHEVEEQVGRLRENLRRRRLHERVVERLGSERKARGLEYAIVGLIAIVLAMLAAEELLPLTEAQEHAFAIIDTLICVLFLWEFFWRMQFADSKWWYFKRHWIDFFASLPLAGALRIGRVARLARGARALRLARLARAARLVRALRALAFLSRGFDKIAAIFRLQVFSRPLILTVALLILGGLVISHLEGRDEPAVQGVWQGIWWSCTTVITGGFGDIHNPQSAAGRVLTVLLVILGMILTGALTAGLASILLGDDTERIERRQALMQAQLDEIGGKLDKIEELIADR